MPWRAVIARIIIAASLLAISAPASSQVLEEPHHCIYPEQREIQYRCPEALCQPDPHTALPPRTFANKECLGEREQMSLNDAICLALSNAEVIRVLGGSSGRTIFDPAITNTQVDVQRSAFDPQLSANTTYNHNENHVPFAAATPSGVDFMLNESDTFNVTSGISQRKAGGATISGGFAATPTNADPGGVLDPSTPWSFNYGISQPLLQGRGRNVNLAPIVIARIDTERSFYQLKDSVQELLRGVIDGYWSIVAARATLWARQQQVEQLEYALGFFRAQLQVGRGDLGDTAQAEVSLANFRATLIAAEADLLNREANLRNLLGLPPVDEVCLVPTTPPIDERRGYDWDLLLRTAELSRPDVIEIKLQIEADEQRLMVADNQALPRVDAVANHQINALGGEGPTGIVNSAFGAHNVQMGVNVALPLGLRAERANLRAAELTLCRDRANLRQQLHAVAHDVAICLRNMEQFYAQYEAFKKVRAASRVNLDRQFAVFRAGGIPTERINYLNVLQAVTDWGNAVSSEAQSLTQYNIELATLQRRVGTIIEDHGVRFCEEQYSSLGPLASCQNYPRSVTPHDNEAVYVSGDEPSEEFFELESRVPESGKAVPSKPKPRPFQPARPLEGIQQPPAPQQQPSNLPPPADDRQPIKPAEPPPQDGRLPGDDMRELMDRIRDTLNPFDDGDE